MKEIKFGGWSLIILGIIFAIKNMFGLDFNISINWNYIWPILLLIWGIWIVYKK